MLVQLHQELIILIKNSEDLLSKHRFGADDLQYFLHAKRLKPCPESCRLGNVCSSLPSCRPLQCLSWLRLIAVERPKCVWNQKFEDVKETAKEREERFDLRDE